MYISNFNHFRVLFLLCAEFFMLHESAFCRFTAFQISIKIASIVFWYFCCRYCYSHSLLICSHIFNSTSLDTHDTWFYESKTYKEIKKKTISTHCHLILLICLVTLDEMVVISNQYLHAAQYNHDRQLTEQKNEYERML